MTHHLLSARLVALFTLGWLALNFPLLAVVDLDWQPWGLPFFPLALFAVWALLIAALALLMGTGAEPGSSDE